MIGVYNYTVVLTYIGMLVSFTGITYAIEGRLKTAMLCLVISGICDMFDGPIAATMVRDKREKRFGVQIDSLSDLICFGVLPAIIAYRELTAWKSRITFIIICLYLLSALVRLAWFNVDEELRQDAEGGRRKIYLGLPVTTVAFIIPVFSLIVHFLCLSARIVWPILMLVLAIAFITPFKVKKISIHLPNLSQNYPDYMKHPEELKSEQTIIKMNETEKTKSHETEVQGQEIKDKDIKDTETEDEKKAKEIKGGK